MWTKDTLKEAEIAMNEAISDYILLASEGLINQEELELNIRRILHQLAYDAWDACRMSLSDKDYGVAWGMANMGIDLDLVERNEP